MATRQWTDRVFLGRLVENLGNLIESQSADLFRMAGIVVPVKSCSLMMAIQTLEPVAAVELARALECSHQLVLQKIPKLLRLGLIEQQPCSDDRRKNLFRLTDKGRGDLVVAAAIFPALEGTYDALTEGSADIFEALEAATTALKRRPLVDRLDPNLIESFGKAQMPPATG